MSQAPRFGRAPVSWLSLSAGLIAFGCLVPDIELVDDLPGSAGHGGEGQSGSASEGGEHFSDSSGGEPTEGGEQGVGGSSGSSAGNDWGGAVGTGGAPSSDIPELGVCASGSYQVCDDFEGMLSDGWPPGITGTALTDAPSGDAVLVVDFGFQPELQLSFTAISVSFWVRLQNKADQRFISFTQGTDELGLGIEHEQARFIHSGMEGVIAPSDDNKTRLIAPATWFCVELRVDQVAARIESRIVVPGDSPVTLPVLDNTPTEGEDDYWNASLAGNWEIDSGKLIFGQNGAYQEFDDVVVGDYDEQTLCDRYLEAIAN